MFWLTRPFDGTRECAPTVSLWLWGHSTGLANLARWSDGLAFEFLLLHSLHELKMRRQLGVSRVLLRRDGLML